MPKRDEFLMIDFDGILYATESKTGISGMTLTGIARACDRPEAEITQLIRTNSLPILARVQVTDYPEIIYTANFCVSVALITALDGSSHSQEFLGLCAEVGLSPYIQAITGWIPKRYRSRVGAIKLAALLFAKY